MTLADYGLARDALRAEVQIDTDAEYMLGDDQAYNCYPTRFPTVEFQLVDTLELSQIADTIRKAKGFSPMLEDGGDMEGWYDFSLGLNGITETSLDTGIMFAVVNSESPDNEGYYSSICPKWNSDLSTMPLTTSAVAITKIIRGSARRGETGHGRRRRVEQYKNQGEYEP